MDKRYRNIYFYDLVTETKAQGFNGTIKPIDIAELLLQMRSSYHARNPFGFSKESVWYSIEAWDYDSNKREHHLLINKSDTNKSDPTFSDPKKKTRKRIRKDKGEGDETSSHIIIKTFEEKNKGLAIVESGAIRGASSLQKIFARIVSHIRAGNPLFEAYHPDGSKDKNGDSKKIKLTVDIHIDAHISASFAKDLEKGVFRDASLISEKKHKNPIDSAGNYLIEYEEIKLKINPLKNFSLTVLRNLFKRKSTEFNKARVRFKSQSGNDRDIEVDTETFTELNYAERNRISSDGVEFESSYEQINLEIIKKMQKLI